MLVVIWMRALLLLYPQAFREEYGPALAETFIDQWRGRRCGAGPVCSAEQV